MIKEAYRDRWQLKMCYILVKFAGFSSICWYIAFSEMWFDYTVRTHILDAWSDWRPVLLSRRRHTSGLEIPGWPTLLPIGGCWWRQLTHVHSSYPRNFFSLYARYYFQLPSFLPSFLLSLFQDSEWWNLLLHLLPKFQEIRSRRVFEAFVSVWPIAICSIMPRKYILT